MYCIFQVRDKSVSIMAYSQYPYVVVAYTQQGTPYLCYVLHGQPTSTHTGLGGYGPRDDGLTTSVATYLVSQPQAFF